MNANMKVSEQCRMFTKTKEIDDKQTLQDYIDILVKKCKCSHTGPGNTGMNNEMGGTK